MTSPTLAWIPQCYPPTRRSDHVDVYRSGARGEVKVLDPYDWLEEDSEEQEKWLAAQEALARNFLDANPDRVRLEEEIRASTDYEKVSTSLMESSDHGPHIEIYYSSVSPHCGMMVDGTGLITAACRRNLMRFFCQSVNHTFTDATGEVYYRSKDSDLPDPAAGAGGEVFFDVRDDFFPQFNSNLCQNISQMFFRVTGQFH